MYNQKYLLLLLYGHIKRVSGINRISGVRRFGFEKGFLLESVLVWILNSGLGPEVAPAVAVLFLAVLLGGPEEPKGLSAHRLIVVGGGVDILFRGGIDSGRRGVFLVAALRFLLEQEPEVFSHGLGLVLLGDGPEVELLCIPVQRSQRFIRCSWVPLRRRLPTLRNGVDGRSREGGRRRRRGRRGISEGVGVGGRRDRHGWRRNGVFLCYLALGGRRSLL